MPITQKEQWKILWEKNFLLYLNTTPRTGIFLRHFIQKDKSIRVLELGAGSCRDSYLLSQYNSVVATDYEQSILEIAKSTYSNKNLTIKVEDARDLSFDRNFFKY